MRLLKIILIKFDSICKYFIYYIIKYLIANENIFISPIKIFSIEKIYSIRWFENHPFLIINLIHTFTRSFNLKI